MASSSALLWQRSGHVLKLTLNRVKALNSLDTDMCADIRKHLVEWRGVGSNDHTSCPPAVFVVKGNGGKAFCAGGDVKTIWQSLVQAKTEVQTISNTEAVKFFSNEYEMNYLLGTSPVPQVSIWDGIVMGGGVGLSVLGDFRIATEKTLFAMPECAIGIFPDVGASWWLTRLPVWQPSASASNDNVIGVPAGFDMFVGMTGSRLNALDLVTMGIATHFVSCNHLEDMEQELMARCPIGNIATRNDEARKSIRTILDNYHQRSLSTLASLPPSTLTPHYHTIQNTFAGKSSVTEIFAALISECDKGSDKGQWAKNTLALLHKQSPTSLALTFEQLRRGRRLLSLKDCLRMEYRLMLNCIGGGSSSSSNEKPRRRYGDFLEGIRAVLVDKDNKPIWEPSTIDAVDKDHVMGCFDAIPGGELDLDQYN